MLSLTGRLDHKGNTVEIFVLTFKVHGQYCVQSIGLERQNKYFFIWTSRSVNKSIKMNYNTLLIRYCI